MKRSLAPSSQPTKPARRSKLSLSKPSAIQCSSMALARQPEVATAPFPHLLEIRSPACENSNTQALPQVGDATSSPKETADPPQCGSFHHLNGSVPQLTHSSPPLGEPVNHAGAKSKCDSRAALEGGIEQQFPVPHHHISSAPQPSAPSPPPAGDESQDRDFVDVVLQPLGSQNEDEGKQDVLVVSNEVVFQGETIEIFSQDDKAGLDPGDPPAPHLVVSAATMLYNNATSQFELGSCLSCGSEITHLAIHEREKHLSECCDGVKSGGLQESGENSSRIKCFFCQMDLTFLSEQQRTYHINDCCDAREAEQRIVATAKYRKEDDEDFRRSHTPATEIAYSNTQDFLLSLELEKYIATFEKANVDLTVMARLRESDLKDMGISVGARKKIVKAQRSLLTAERKAKALGVPDEKIAADLVDMGGTAVHMHIDVAEPPRRLMRIENKALGLRFPRACQETWKDGKIGDQQLLSSMLCQQQDDESGDTLQLALALSASLEACDKQCWSAMQNERATARQLASAAHLGHLEFASAVELVNLVYPVSRVAGLESGIPLPRSVTAIQNVAGAAVSRRLWETSSSKPPESVDETRQFYNTIMGDCRPHRQAAMQLHDVQLQETCVSVPTEAVHRMDKEGNCMNGFMMLEEDEQLLNDETFIPDSEDEDCQHGGHASDLQLNHRQPMAIQLGTDRDPADDSDDGLQQLIDLLDAQEDESIPPESEQCQSPEEIVSYLEQHIESLTEDERTAVRERATETILQALQEHEKKKAELTARAEVQIRAIQKQLEQDLLKLEIEQAKKVEHAILLQIHGSEMQNSL